MSRFWMKSSVVGLVAAGLAVAFGAGEASAARPTNRAPVASVVPWNGKDLTQRHPILSGESTTVKGTASDSDGTVAYYQWDFSNGGSTGQLAVVDPNVLSAEATYTGAAGQDVTATLTVWDDKGATATATYLMKIMADTVEVRNNVAIDKALWWVHKQLVRYNFNDDPGKPCAYLANNEWNPGMVTDAFALQGFEEQGHLPGNSANNDPYVEDARRLLNRISSFIFVMNSQTKGDGSPEFPVVDPDANLDGVLMGTFEDHYEYEMGVILKAILNSGMGASSPGVVDATLNITGDPLKVPSAYTYDQIAQNMIEFIAWAQLYDHPNDYTVYNGATFVGPSKVETVALNPKSRGSWPYWAEGWDDPLTGERGGWGDMAVAFWVSLGLQEAKDRGTFTIPAFLDIELAKFVDPSNGVQNLTAGDPNRGEVYFGPNDGVHFHNSYHLVERAAELLVVLNYLGIPQGDDRASAALGFIDRSWNTHTYDTAQSHPIAANCWWDELGRHCEATPVSDNRLPYFVRLNEYVNGSYVTDRGWEDNGAPGGNFSFFHLYDSDGTNVTWGFEEGTYVDGVWTPTKTGDDLNIFAFYAVSRALNGYGITDFPTTDSLTWDARFTELLTNNQLPDGSFNEYNWVSGSPFGTPWALMTMVERDVVASDNTMSVLEITFSTSTAKNGTETLATKVKIVDAVGAPVVGASVTGTLTKDGATLLPSGSQLTDAAGQASFSYSRSKQPLAAGIYTFTVTGVAKDGLVLSTTLPVEETFTK